MIHLTRFSNQPQGGIPVSVSAETITVTCNDCAYYAPTSMYCMEWTTGVRAGDEACGRFVACDGSGPLEAIKTTKDDSGQKVKPKAAPAASNKPKRLNMARNTNGLPGKDELTSLIAKLLLQGHGQKAIAKKLGVSKNTASKYIGWTLDAGKVVRVGRGRYAAPGSTDALESEKQLDSLVVAKHILGGLTQAEIAAKHKVCPQSISYHVNKAVKRGELVKVGLGEYEAGPALETGEQTPTSAELQVDKAQMRPDTPKPGTSPIGQQSSNLGSFDHDHSSDLDKLTRRLDELRGTLQADLLKIGEWAMRLDKCCDQLDARIDKLEETLLERLTDIGLLIAGVQNDIVRVDQQLKNELERVVTNQRIISDQLDELRDMVAGLQAEQWQRPQRMDAGSSDLVNRLLSVLEAQQRLMERQLAGQRVGTLDGVERVGVERVSRTEGQEVA